MALPKLEKSEAAAQWVPAFPTEQVRGLKAHGTTTEYWGTASSITILSLALSGGGRTSQPTGLIDRVDLGTRHRLTRLPRAASASSS